MGYREVQVMGPSREVERKLGHQATISALERLLGGYVSPDVFIGSTLQAVAANPKLERADELSFLSAMFGAASIRLVPGTPQGYAYILPFEMRKAGTVKAQLIVGYTGYMELARRSGRVQTMRSMLVRQGDVFEVDYGAREPIVHRPADDDLAPWTHAYALWWPTDSDAPEIELLSRQRIFDRHRALSSGYRYAEKTGRKDSPWHTHEEAMARKTPWRVAHTLPMSDELAQARVLEERTESGARPLITHEMERFLADGMGIDPDKARDFAEREEEETEDEVETKASVSKESERVRDAPAKARVSARDRQTLHHRYLELWDVLSDRNHPMVVDWNQEPDTLDPEELKARIERMNDVLRSETPE